MKRTSYVLWSFVFSVSLLTVAFVLSHNQEESFQPSSLALKGFVLGLTTQTSASQVNDNLCDVANMGANAVLLTVSEEQQDWRSSVIRPNPSHTLPLQMISRVIQLSRKKDLAVVLMPLILLQTVYSRLQWRGMIRPDDVPAWFSSYRYMIAKYAELAEQEHVSYFVVGSELVSMERFEEQWRKIILAVRSRFSGKILYSSNWDHLKAWPVWKDLDLVGCNAYFALVKGKNASSLTNAVSQWKKRKEELFRWSFNLQKPLMITEIGYPSRKFGLMNPWDHTQQDDPDPQVQWLGYKAFLQVFGKAPAPYGIFFYEWVRPGGLEDSGYTPRGKPTEELLKAWMAQNQTR